MATHAAPQQNQQELSVVITSSKLTYHIGEPLHLDIQIINVSDKVLRLDYRIIFRGHVSLTITDESNQMYLYPSWNSTFRIVPPQRVEDFIKLPPGQCVGRLNFTDDEVVINHVGNYKLRVSYSEIGASSSGKEFGIEAWSGGIDADPIEVQIVGHR
jgi:hypothetical protein